MVNKKEVIIISLFVIAIMGFGMGMGYSLGTRIKCEPKIQKVEIEKLVNPCSKAFGNAEKAMCHAKDACNDKLGDFKFDGFSQNVTFNCEK